MADQGIPNEPPPPYAPADPKLTGKGKTSQGAGASSSGAGSSSSSSIPVDVRRSMEDEARSLPKGWIRQYDSKEHHHFYVDTRSDPARSIWCHPYDDETYLETLPSEERERIQDLTRHPSMADIIAMASDDEADHDRSSSHQPGKSSGKNAELPPRPEMKSSKSTSWGRRVKDKMTGTTHGEREEQRRKRAEEEKRAYEAHMAFRRAFQKAAETGERQLVGKDKNGKEVYVEPPQDMGSYGGGYRSGYPGSGYGVGLGGYGSGYGYGGVDPYAQSYYASPSSRYYRPSQPYGRRAGYGYGGGYGLPIAGGLAGGLLLGEMMGGGMGMGMGGMGMGMGGMGMGMGGMGGGM